jgi:hypothetical protein
MRITQRERDLATFLPATVLVPNEAEVKAAFADVLVGAMGVLQAPPEPCLYCGRDICACPPRRRPGLDKICRRCAMPWRLCICTCSQCGLSRYGGCSCPRPDPDDLERATVEVVSDPELAHVNVDGKDVNLHLVEATREQLRDRGIPEVFIEQGVGALQTAMENDPMAFLSYLRGETERGKES